MINMIITDIMFSYPELLTEFESLSIVLQNSKMLARAIIEFNTIQLFGFQLLQSGFDDILAQVWKGSKEAAGIASIFTAYIYS